VRAVDVPGRGFVAAHVEGRPEPAAGVPAVGGAGEIDKLEEGLLESWSQPEPAAYKGQHGLHIARVDWE